MHGSHIVFINEGLVELEKRMRQSCGVAHIAVRAGLTCDVLQQFSVEAGLPICSIHSHAIVGDTVDRLIDEEVQSWCCNSNALWQQHDQYGIRHPALHALDLEDEERRQIHALEPQIARPTSWPRFAVKN